MGRKTVQLTGEREGKWWSECWVKCVLITPTLIFTDASVITLFRTYLKPFAKLL